MPGCEVEWRTPGSSVSDTPVESLKIEILAGCIFLVDSSNLGDMGISGKVDREVAVEAEIEEEELDRRLENENSAVPRLQIIYNI